jgi:hypothetical protein
MREDVMRDEIWWAVIVCCLFALIAIIGLTTVR